jgi:cytochrome c-type biogenesis protein CcmE
VVDGSVDKQGDSLTFEIRDREGSAKVPVTYEGVVPDPFREGREVIVSGTLEGKTFVAERDSLITKCPSKFTKDDKST